MFFGARCSNYQKVFSLSIPLDIPWNIFVVIAIVFADRQIDMRRDKEGRLDRDKRKEREETETGEKEREKGKQR